MKKITNKEYAEWQIYKEEKNKGHILLPDMVRFICESCSFDPEKIGRYILEVLPVVCPHAPRAECLDNITDFGKGILSE